MDLYTGVYLRHVSKNPYVPHSTLASPITQNQQEKFVMKINIFNRAQQREVKLYAIDGRLVGGLRQGDVFAIEVEGSTVETTWCQIAINEVDVLNGTLLSDRPAHKMIDLAPKSRRKISTYRKGGDLLRFTEEEEVMVVRAQFYVKSYDLAHDPPSRGCRFTSETVLPVKTLGDKAPEALYAKSVLCEVELKDWSELQQELLERGVAQPTQFV